MTSHDYPVLIVGGGPVGMAQAWLLNRFGIASLVIERSATTTNHPKARGLTARTMELLRVWGIEDIVRAGGLGHQADVVQWCERLSGPFEGTTRPEGSNSSPAPKSMVPQDVVENALAGLLANAPHVEFRRRTELVDLRQDDAGVRAEIADLESGVKTTVRARYGIACDGAASGTRRQLGIQMDGPLELARFANHYFSADLHHLPHLRGVLGFMAVPPDPNSQVIQVLGANPDCNRFVYMQKLQNDNDAPIPERELVALMRYQWDMPALEIKRINVLNWRMSAQVARSYRKDNVFLAGDAAHRFPPTGGMGMNSGFQDVHNLAWKLAMVLRGIAAPELLDTYEAERRPVALCNSRWSTGNFDRLGRMVTAFRGRHEDPAGWRAAVIDSDNHLHSEGQAMGYIYESGAVINDTPPELPLLDSRYYWPTDIPGARFPHVWQDAAWTQTTIDWFDTSFVLVCGPAADNWRRAGEVLARETRTREGVCLLAIRSLQSMAGPFSFGVDGAALVRPDGHVAWLSIGTVSDHEATLRKVINVLLSGGRDMA